MSDDRSLIEIFQAITTKKASGTLVVTEGQKNNSLYFREGALVKISRDQKQDFELAEYLVKAEKITTKELQDILIKAQTSAGSKTMVDIIREEDLLSEEELKTQLVEKTSSDLYDLFLLKDAEFEFKKEIDECREEDSIEFIKFDLIGFLQELISRMSEFETIREQIPSTKTIFVRTDSFDESLKMVPLSAKIREESVIIDGRKTVEEIVQTSPLGRFDLFHLLAELYREGGIEPMGAQEAFDSFRQAQKQKKSQEALKYLISLRTSPHLALQNRLKMAEIYKEIRNTDVASEEFRKTMNGALASGELEVGIEAGEKLLKLRQGDPEAMVTLLELYRQNGSEKTLEHGTDVGFFFEREGKNERAYEVFEGLYKSHPNDVEVNKGLAKAASKIGKREEAIRSYEFLLEKATSSQQKKQYQQALVSLDPSRAYEEEGSQSEVGSFLDGVEAAADPDISSFDVTTDLFGDEDSGSFDAVMMDRQGAQVAPKKKTNFKAYFFVSLAVLLLLGGYGFYEVLARSSLQSLKENLKEEEEKAMEMEKEAMAGDPVPLEELKKAGELHLKMASRYKEYLGTYGYSLASSQAKQKRRHHRQLSRRIEKAIRDIKAKDESKKEEIQLAFNRLLAEAQRLEKEGKLKEAVARYLEIARRFPQFEKRISLPLSIVTQPPGALVKMGDKELGKTPYQGRFSLPEKGYVQITLKREGYWPKEIKKAVVDPIDERLLLRKETPWYQHADSFTDRGMATTKDYLAFMGKDGFGYILSRESGKVIKKVRLGLWGDRFSSLHPQAESFLVSNPEGKIYRFSPLGSEMIIDLEEPVEGKMLSVKDNHFFVATRGGKIYGFNAQGKEFFDFELKGVALPNLLYHQDRLYAALRSGKIFAFDGTKILTGLANTKIWEKDLNFRSQVRNGLQGYSTKRGDFVILLAYINGTLAFVEGGEGRVLSQLEVEGKILDSPVIVTGDSGTKICLSTTAGVIYVIDGEKQKILWEKKVPSELTANLTAGVDHLYLSVKENSQGDYYHLSHLKAWSLEKGEEVWTYPVLGQILGKPTFSQKKVYLSTTEGYIYAIAD